MSAPANAPASVATAPALQQSTVRGNDSQLFIGDLPPNTTEKELADFFTEQKYQVSVIRLGRKNNAFVQADPKVIDAILNNSTYMTFKDKELVLTKMLTVAHRTSPKLNLFLHYVPLSFTANDLHDIFSKEISGKTPSVCSCRVGKRPVKVKEGNDDKSYNFGFVCFDVGNEDIVESYLNQKTVSDPKLEKPIEVLRYTPIETGNLFLKEFPAEYKTPEDVQNWVKANAPADFNGSMNIPVKDDGKLVGYAFVDFGSKKNALDFISKVTEATEADKKMYESQFTTGMSGFKAKLNGVYINRFQRRAEREGVLTKKRIDNNRLRHAQSKDRNLYVKGFPLTYSDDQLKVLFSEFGEIESLKVMKDEESRSKGFGFVCFKTKESAEMAIGKLNNALVDGKALVVCIAQLKGERQRMLSQKQTMARPMYPYMDPSTGMPPQYAMPFAPQFAYPPPPHMQMQSPQMRFAQPPYGQPRPQMPPRNYPPMYPGPNGQFPMRPPFNAKPPMPRGPPQMPMPVPSSGPVTSDLRRQLEAIPTADGRKEFLGDKIYTIVENLNPALAPKITGMLLELTEGEVVFLLENRTAMEQKVREAQDMITKSGPTQK